MTTTHVKNNAHKQRYELLDGEDEVLGFADYGVLQDGNILISHSEILPAFEGKGFGSQLMRQVLDDIRAKGKQVVPSCSFTSGYIARHPEYEDLVLK